MWRDAPDPADRAELSARESLVCDLLAIYIARIDAGHPHRGVDLIRQARRDGGPAAETLLLTLMAAYEALQAVDPR